MIDSETGVVSVAGALDYDTTTSYSLTVRATDGGTIPKTDDATLTISVTNVNDVVPTFSQSEYTANVNENVATSTSVLTVTASIIDAGAAGTITYSIVSGTGSAKFSVGSTTGVISTSAAIDYEESSFYHLVVKAQDGGSPVLSSSCYVKITVIDLNDNTPVFPGANIAVSVNENTAPPTEVTVAAATDADSVSGNNNVIVYTFQAASTKFTIGANDGSIKIQDTLDRDTVARYM